MRESDRRNERGTRRIGARRKTRRVVETCERPQLLAQKVKSLLSGDELLMSIPDPLLAHRSTWRLSST